MIAIEDPKLVLIIGCVGFGLNVLVMSFLHGMSQQFWTVRDVELNFPKSMTTNTDTSTRTTMTTTITAAMVTVIVTAMTKETRRIYPKHPLNQILSLVTVIERDLSLA